MKKRDKYQTGGRRKRLTLVIISTILLMAATYIFDGPITNWFVLGGSSGRNAHAQSSTDPAASAKAFLAASKVFFHPRCVNCHPAGDSPLQGDEGRIHSPSVKRGPEGTGVAGIRCSVCHQTSNQSIPHMPPGAPGWKLPPQSTPMIFEKRTPKQLCLQLKDPTQNGNLSVKEVLDHIKDAPLVLWGWNPGEGRNPVPMTHDEFVKLMTEWVDKGASCPE
jgi:hypothetical protein